MSRSMIIGNGKLLVGLDHYGQVRDLYFPHVGLENHVGGHYKHRIGVFVNGKLSWLSDGDWTIEVRSQEESLIGEIEALNNTIGVKIVFKDAVSHDNDIFLRHLTITNNSTESRNIKIFFGHEFEFYESHAAHTAFYDPRSSSIIHYRQTRVFLTHATLDKKSFTDYTTGIFDKADREGSYRDADDGTLSKNGIEHGQADSVIGLESQFGPGKSKVVRYWLVAGKSINEVHNIHKKITKGNFDTLIKNTEIFWKSWVNKKQWNFEGLSSEIIDLFKKSLMFARAHADNAGGIIASSDSSMLQYGKDSYAYVWPRDAVFTIMALFKSGSYTATKEFFRFCARTIEPEGYFLHKYNPDGSLGSSWHPWVKAGKFRLPIQEDETALVLQALWRYYVLTKDIDFIESVYKSLVDRPAKFLIKYIDKKTGLPMPSYDLWEQVYGIHTFTSSTVYAALFAASKLISLFEGEGKSLPYKRAAAEIRKGIFKHLYDDDDRIFFKSIVINDDGSREIDRRIDVSSFYGVFSFGVCTLDDKRLLNMAEKIKNHLIPGKGLSGVARYDGDNYFKTKQDIPGNPWIITTLWLADYYISSAKEKDDLDKAEEFLKWVVSKTNTAGILPEQVNYITGEQVSAAPLSWSHASFVSTVIRYIEKKKELGIIKSVTKNI